MNNQNKITVPSPDMSLNPDLQLFYETAVFVDDEEFSAVLRVSCFMLEPQVISMHQLNPIR